MFRRAQWCLQAGDIYDEFAGLRFAEFQNQSLSAVRLGAERPLQQVVRRDITIAKQSAARQQPGNVLKLARRNRVPHVVPLLQSGGSQLCEAGHVRLHIWGDVRRRSSGTQQFQ